MRYSRSYSGVEVHQIHYPRPYTFIKFVGDVILTFLTGGLWLIWIFCREMRRR